MLLEVPSLPCVVDDGVFDAWAWCASDIIEWRRPLSSREPLRSAARIEGENPPGLVFVMRDSAGSYLPRELARLHAFGYGLEEEYALAPYAIDDATDLLHERRQRPHDVFWLAASTIEALVWGLHDWAHFHNHDPFDQPAMTELQCDLVALAWLRGNAARIAIDTGSLARVADDLAALSRARFAEEHVASPVADLEALFRAPYPTQRLRPGAGVA